MYQYFLLYFQLMEVKRLCLTVGTQSWAKVMIQNNSTVTLFLFLFPSLMWLQLESSSFKNGFLKYLTKVTSPFPYGPVCF